MRRADLAEERSRPIVPIAAARTEPPSALRTRRARIALTCGAALGFALALTSIFQKRERALVPADAAATVNGAPIGAADLERAVRALASDRREPPSQAERRALLERLIDEELLVQRAKELGTVEHDRTVRARLVSAMMETILADADGAEPSAEEVSAFYRENAGFFAPLERAWLRDMRIDVSEARPEAEARRIASEASARIRSGEDFAAVGRELGDPPIAPLPDGLLPTSKLREYLGPSVVRSAAALTAGAVSDPVRGGSAFHVLQMVERQVSAPPPLEAIEGDVRAEIRRRKDDLGLRAYLDRLREQATIRLREP